VISLNRLDVNSEEFRALIVAVQDARSGI